MRYQLDDLIIDVSKQRVWRSGQLLDVSSLSFQFLVFMLKKGSAVVTFDDLTEGVWNPVVVNQETITQRVRLLRRGLGDDGRRPRYIRSVRGQGYQLVIGPRLLSEAVDKNVWPARNTLRPMLFVTAAMVVIVMIALSDASRFGIKPSGTLRDMSAASKFLDRANYYAGIGQKDDNERAIKLFQRVLREESGNVAAMVGLSLSYSRSVCRFNVSSNQATQAEVIAREVLAVEPRNARAYHALGYSQDCRGQTDAAIGSYLRAMELDSSVGIKSMSALAYNLGETGRLVEALTMNLAVGREDPQQTFTILQLGRIYELLGLRSVAEELYSESFELFPDNIFSNLAYPRYLFNQRQFNAAREVVAIAKTRPVHPELFILSGELALIDAKDIKAESEFTYAVAMRPSSAYFDSLVKIQDNALDPAEWAPTRIESLQNKANLGSPDAWIELALLYQALGQQERGLKALSAAVDSGYRNGDYLQVSPLFDELRSTPGFAGVIARIDSAVELQLEELHSRGLPATLAALR